jgi:hypothetical protein
MYELQKREKKRKIFQKNPKFQYLIQISFYEVLTFYEDIANVCERINKKRSRGEKKRAYACQYNLFSIMFNAKVYQFPCGN